MDGETRLLHETILRLAKMVAKGIWGILNAYEHWFKVKTGQEPPSIELPRSGETN
jgi:hypothetical protein